MHINRRFNPLLCADPHGSFDPWTPAPAASIPGQTSLRYGEKASAVQRSGTMGKQRLLVSGRAVSLVRCQAILRILLVQLTHPAVAVNLGHHRSGGNRDA
jgi:hypothetical protein